MSKEVSGIDLWRCGSTMFLVFLMFECLTCLFLAVIILNAFLGKILWGPNE